MTLGSRGLRVTYATEHRITNVTQHGVEGQGLKRPGVRRRITEHERLRRSLGFTQQDVADRVECSRGYVSQVEGGRSPSPDYRRRVAAMFEMPEEVIFGEVE